MTNKELTDKIIEITSRQIFVYQQKAISDELSKQGVLYLERKFDTITDKEAIQLKGVASMILNSIIIGLQYA